jgi:hypothetical protein
LCGQAAAPCSCIGRSGSARWHRRSAPAASTGTPQTPFGFTGELADGNGLLYLRAAPSSTASILAEVPFGATVAASARNATGCYQVSYGRQMGYLSSA